MLFADWQNGAAKLLVQHFTHRQIDGASATDQTDPARNLNDAFVISQVTNRQQREQHGQTEENKLQHTRGFQGAKEHKQGKNAP